MKTQFTLHKNNARRIAMFVALFALSAIAFIACDKQNALVEPKTENAEAYKFSYQGKIYEAEEFERLFKDKDFPLMVAGTDMPEENTIYVFDSKADYQGWAQTTPFVGKLAQVDEAIAKARNNPNANPAALSKGAGEGGIVALCDGNNFDGEKFFAGSTTIVSNLGTFYRKTSSVVIYNPSTSVSYATILSLHTDLNFQGLQFILINNRSEYYFNFKLPYNSDYNKSWDNRAASFIVL